MELRAWLIGLLLFSGVITGFGIYASDFLSKYSVNIQNPQELSVVNDIQSVAQSMEASIRGSQITGISLIDYPLMIASGVYNVLKLAFVSLTSIVGNLINQIGMALGLPFWFISIITTMAVSSLIFSVAYAILKWKGD